MKFDNTIDDEWPTFRGCRLTMKERQFGLVITPIFPNDIADPNKLISRVQLFMGRGGRLFFELRYGSPAMETVNNRSTLPVESVRQLNAEALRIHPLIAKIAGQQEREREVAEEKAYQIVIERRKIEIPNLPSPKNKAA